MKVLRKMDEKEQQMLLDNMGLVNWWLKRHCSSLRYVNADYEDVKSELTLVLASCVLSFNSSKGTFSTYAVSAFDKWFYSYYKKNHNSFNLVSLDCEFLVNESTGEPFSIYDVIATKDDCIAFIEQKILVDEIKAFIRELGFPEYALNLFADKLNGERVNCLAAKYNISRQWATRLCNKIASALAPFVERERASCEGNL